MARSAKGLDLAVEVYETGDLDRAAQLVRKQHQRAAKRQDHEALTHVDEVWEQMRGHLEGEELARFDALVAFGHVPIDVSPLGFWLAVAGAVAMLIAVFLPEADVTAFAAIENNTLIQSGDGWLFIVLGLAGLASAYHAYRSRRRTWWPLVDGLLTVGLAFADGRPSNLHYCSVLVKTQCTSGSPGIGLYLVGIGGGLMALGGWQLRTGNPTPSLELDHEGTLYADGSLNDPDITPEAGGANSDVIEQIERLGRLRDSGLISSEEFETKKTELLSRL